MTTSDKPRRGPPTREPRTIDLEPTAVVEETAPLAGAAAEPKGTEDPNSRPPGGESGPHEPPASAEAAAKSAEPAGPSPRRAGLGKVAVVAAVGGITGAIAALVAPSVLLPRDDGAERAAAQRALDERVDRSLAAAVPRRELEALDRRVTDLAGGLKAVSDRLGAVAGKTDDAARRADDLARRLAAAPPAAGTGAGDGAAMAAVAELTAKVDALDTALKSLDPAAGAAARNAVERTASLEGRVAALEKLGAAPKALTRVVLAMALQRAVESTRPYQAELAAVRAAGADPGSLAPLEKFAATGMPSSSSLTRDFASLAGEIRAAAVPAHEGWLERLRRNAEHIVRVRPIDDQGGEDARALMARIEAALKRRDFAAAAKAWEGLPEAARQASQAWHERLKGRMATEAAAHKVTADGLSALTQQEAAAR